MISTRGKDFKTKILEPSQKVIKDMKEYSLNFQKNVREKIIKTEDKLNNIKLKLNEVLKKFSSETSNLKEEEVNNLLQNKNEMKQINSFVVLLKNKINIFKQIKQKFLFEDIIFEQNKNNIGQNYSSTINLFIHKKRKKIFQIQKIKRITKRIKRRYIYNNNVNNNNIIINNNINNSTSDFKNINNNIIINNSKISKNKKIVIKNNKRLKFEKRVRHPFKYTTTPLPMTKYLVNVKFDELSLKKLSKESSEYSPKEVKIEPSDDYNHLNNCYQSLYSKIKNNLDYINIYPQIKKSFENHIQIRTIYFGNYDMTKNPPHYYSNKLIKENISEIEYKYVKTVIVKNTGEKIYNLIMSCFNFYKEYIMRKDINGNAMIKGELFGDFIKYKNYFLSGNKSFENIKFIQFEVYLFKCDLYLDYSKIDKTNITSERIEMFNDIGKDLNELRIVEKKIEILNKNNF